MNRKSGGLLNASHPLKWRNERRTRAPRARRRCGESYGFLRTFGYREQYDEINKKWKNDRLKKLIYGVAKYRSRYLAHAKRALYHLSYDPDRGKRRIIRRYAPSDT